MRGKVDPGETRLRFDEVYWENAWATVRILQIKSKRRSHELHGLFKSYLPAGKKSLFEVGCALGSWMAYFSKDFGYKVDGIELAPLAHAKTIQNLRLLGIKATVYCGDVLSFTGGPYDIVFSYGFVEHFPDTDLVLKKLGDLCKPGGYVVTAVPSMEGLNWWISRTCRPSVAAGHYPIGIDGLEEMHRRQGFETICLRRYGGFFLVSPWEKTTLAKKMPMLARWLGAPVYVWNRAISELTRLTRWYPQPSSVFAGTIYIGRKPDEPRPVLERLLTPRHLIRL